MRVLFERLAEYAYAQPDQVAIQGADASGDCLILTYQALWGRIRALSETLLALDTQMIGLAGDNSVSWVLIDLAAAYAGISIVPIPPFFTAEQQHHVLDTAGVDWVIGSPHPDVALSHASVTTLAGLPCHARDVDAPPALPPAVKVTFTSGSTGSPKGVVLSAATLESVSVSLANTVSTTAVPSCHLVVLPLSTLLENITGVYVPLLLGVTTVIPSSYDLGLVGSSQLNLNQLMSGLIRYRPQSLVLTPALLRAVIHLGEQHPGAVADLKHVAVGGAKVPPGLLRAASRLGLSVFEGYGLSECGSVVSLNTSEHYCVGSVGKPLPHHRVFLAPDGEIMVAGATFSGYLDRDFHPHQGAVATGDIGEFDDDGFLYVKGRKKNQLITAFGRNIHPEWIEAEAMAYSALSNMVVLGEGKDYLTAIIGSDSPDQAKQQLMQLNHQLPDYAQLRAVIFTAPFHQQPHLITANGRPKRDVFCQQFEPQLNTSAQPLLTDETLPLTAHS
ncbi:hypothetical protein BZG20_05980 [Salinivibrio sp. IB868]|uniref:AMP-binding protein n=1 Tax=unclassified Salinivibrio TaxID=2636825 RepID=UPI000984CF9E|nr:MULTISPECIES: AMP-binding protein [unclassified Salinivibrio]OOE67565.1 hypothetical protein BZG20_05980 [Salinivibrio sp. IB868]OOE70785.1 hypothetical protein BZG22_15665 [Salinivibrio sp. IB870]